MARRPKTETSDPPERATAQIQVYLLPELLSWLDKDREACQEEVQADMGQQQHLSRSAHVVAILHQYRITKEISDAAGGPPGGRAFWQGIRRTCNLLEPGQAKKKTKRAKVKS